MECLGEVIVEGIEAAGRIVGQVHGHRHGLQIVLHISRLLLAIPHQLALQIRADADAVHGVPSHLGLAGAVQLARSDQQGLVGTLCLVADVLQRDGIGLLIPVDEGQPASNPIVTSEQRSILSDDSFRRGGQGIFCALIGRLGERANDEKGWEP